MDNEARGEVTAPIVLRDEDGETFAFLPIPVIRDGPDLFPFVEGEGLSLHARPAGPRTTRSAS